MLLGKKLQNINVIPQPFKKLLKLELESSKQVKLLRVTIDNNVAFYSYVRDLCKKQSKSKAFISRIRGFLSQSQCDYKFNDFVMPRIESKKYC